MNTILKWLLSILFIIMLLATVRGALAVHDCTLDGLYYECTTGNTLSGTIDFGDKGVWIHDMEITISGANGQSGDVHGDDATFSIESDYKVLINNVNITLTGGNGYSESNNDGGNGGNVKFAILGTDFDLLNNTKIIANGGIGANGDAIGSDAKDGGYGGTVTLLFQGNNLTTNYFNFSGTQGDNGHSRVACSSGTERKSGNIANPSYFYIYSTSYNGNGTISIAGGDGSNADTCSDEGGDAHGNGGNGASVYLISNSSKSIISHDDVTFISGSGGEGDYVNEDAGDGGDAGSIYYDFSQVTGDIELKGDYESSTGNKGDGESGSDGGVAYDGKQGIVDLDISGNNILLSGKFNVNSNALIPSCSISENVGDEDCSGESAISQTHNFVSNNDINFTNYNLYIISTHGGNSGATDDGNGGTSGTITFNLNGTTYYTNSTFKLEGRAGGQAKHSDATSSIEGRGGSVIVNSNNNLNSINSNINFLSGNTGGGGDNGEAGQIKYSNNYLTNLKSSNFTMKTGNNDNSSPGIGGELFVIIKQLILNNSLLSSITGEDTASSLQTQVNISNSTKIINSELIIKSIGDGTCKPAELYLLNNKLFETINSNITLETALACNNYILATGEEFNFLNNTILNMTSATGAGIINLTLLSSKSGLPGLIRWNYTELGSTITANVLSTQTSYNSSRGSLTETGTWSWNNSVNNVVYDDYFTRIQNVEFQKISSDKGPDLYNYTNFTCRVKVDLGSYLEGTPLINFTILNGTSTFESSNSVSIVDNEYVNATFQINGSNTEIGNTWNCSAIVYETTFENDNSTLKNINYTYPYNVTIWIGQNKKVAGSVGVNYLIDNVNITIDRGTLNEYIQNNCTESPCLIPFEFRSDTSATINITRLNVTYGVENPVSENSTSTSSFPIVFNSSREGQLIAEDAYFIYKDNEETDVKLDGRTSIETIYNWISVLYSQFTFNLTPSFVDNYDVYPLWLDQKNVKPYGQSKTMSIYNITRMDNANHSFELRMKIENNTGSSCTDVYFSKDNNINNKFKIVEGNYTYFKNMTWNDVNNTQLWSWVDFNNCNSSEVRYFWPEFVIKSKANGTVDTVGFWND